MRKRLIGLFTTLLVLSVSYGVRAQNDKLQQRDKDEIEQRLKTLPTSNEEIKETQSELQMCAEVYGNSLRYVFKRADGHNYIRVYVSQNKTYSIETNFKISLPKEYYLFSYSGIEENTYGVSSKGRKAIVNSDIAAQIVAINWKMEDDSQTEIVEPDEQTKDKFVQTYYKTTTNKEEQKTVFVPQTDIDLLAYQNRLLNQRKSALIIGVSGMSVAAIGGVVSFAATDTNTKIVGSRISIGGVVIASIGGLWFIVNEFQMINTQKKLNKAMTLRYGPDGIALQF